MSEETPQIGSGQVPDPIDETSPLEYEFMDDEGAVPQSDSSPVFEDDDTVVPATTGEQPQEADSSLTPAEPSVDAAAPPPAETPATEPDTTLQAKAEAYDEIAQRVSSDPAAVAAAIVSQMDIRTRAEFLGQFNPDEAVHPQFNTEEYEPQSDMESAIKDRWGDIESIPHVIAETRNLQSAIKSQQELLVPHISEANVASQIALAKIDALCEALGLQLDEPDLGKIVKALRTENTSYKDAVRSAANYKQAVDTHKQTRARRPVTPANSSNQPEPVKEGSSMLEIYRQFGLRLPQK